LGSSFSANQGIRLRNVVHSCQREGMISSLVSEEKTTPKKNQPIKTPKINKRKNKNINIV
jgi:hypothetical protein